MRPGMDPPDSNLQTEDELLWAGKILFEATVLQAVPNCSDFLGGIARDKCLHVPPPKRRLWAAALNKLAMITLQS